MGLGFLTVFLRALGQGTKRREKEEETREKGGEERGMAAAEADTSHIDRTNIDMRVGSIQDFLNACEI